QYLRAMKTRWGALCFSLIVGTTICAAPPASADEDEARASFKEGARLIEQAEWASAITSFEKSLAQRPHALTLYNIGVCQRFLGRYPLARETLKSALKRSEGTNELAAMFVDQAKSYLGEIDLKLAHLTITLVPPDTRVAVDGRPLAPSPDGDSTFIAGIAEP